MYCTYEQLLENQNEERIFQDDNKYVMFPIPEEYEDIWKLYKIHEEAIWKREDIDIESDVDTWRNLDKDKKGFIKMILAFFAASDGIVNENIAVNFATEVQVSVIRAYYTLQEFIESVHCVVGDTPILTDKGYFPIETLEGQKVNVWNGEEFSEVDIKYTGDSEIYKVILDNGMELDCTPGHKWLIRKGNPRHPESCKTERTETNDLKIGDIISRYDLPIIKQGSTDFQNPYIHGFFCGDGSYAGKNNKYPMVCLYGEKKKLMSNFDTDRFTESETCIRFYITGKINKQKFEVPIVCDLDTRLRWLEGLYDSDGCVSYNKRKDATGIQIASINNDFLKDVQLMLTTIGVISRISLMRKAGKSLLPLNDGSGYFNTKECFVLYITCKDVNKLMKNGFSPKRQLLTCDKIVESTNGTRLIRIRRIEKISENERTFCFNEPKKHTGIFNGILTGQSETYSALIEGYIDNDDERNKLFHAIDNYECIQKKAKWTLKWMNKEIPFAIRILAFAVVEGLFFSGSFCAIFWLKDQNINLKGLFAANQYIARDEGIHTSAAIAIFKKLKYIPDQNIVHEIFYDAVDIETQFITESIPCKMIGMNSDLMVQYIKFVSDRLLLQLGYEKLFGVKNPFDFMERISLDNVSNFHTQRVTEYSRGQNIQKVKSTKDFDTTSDF